MLPFRTDNTHEKYTATYQHWCPQSEKYAGGDHLISAFREGWQLVDDIVKVERHWKSGTRPVKIYYFSLERDDETMVMPVLHNPFVDRCIIDLSLTLVHDETAENRYVAVPVKG